MISLCVSLCVSYFQAPSCNQIADNLLADIIKLFPYNNCALDEKFLRKKFSSFTTLQGWSSHTGMFVLDGFGNFMPNERIFHMWSVNYFFQNKKMHDENSWNSLLWRWWYQIVEWTSAVLLVIFSRVREFLASQTLNNDLTVWKYQQTLQLQSTENCMKLTFYEYRTKHT
jgi:hypothetical protein